MGSIYESQIQKRTNRLVIPAKAGIQENIANLNKWIPAFAGMTSVFFTVTVYEIKKFRGNSCYNLYLT
jgi:hypothetical protein